MEHDMMENMEMTAEEMLMSEDQLINGLLQAAEFKADASLWKKVQIKRDGKLLFMFRVRPLEEEETQDIRRRCTRTMPNPAGRHLPKVDVETNFVRVRSMKIYEATVDEDKARLWDNKAVQKRLNCLSALDVIDQVFMAGEKDAVVDLIDSISGYGTLVEDFAKN